MTQPLQECTIEVLQPITAPGDLYIDGAISVHLYNAGTAAATLDGNQTIPAGASFMVAVPIPNIVISSRHLVTFGAGTTRLQVSVLRIKGGRFSNYEHQKQEP